MSKVFITHDSGLDFAAAKPYGELVHLITGPVNVFQPEKVQAWLGEKLADFDPIKDYILPAGNSVAVALAFAWLAIHATSSPTLNLRILIFDSRKKEYFVRTVAV